MRLAFTGAVDPLARVPLLSAPDVFVVEVLHQPIHIAEVTNRAAIPPAYSDLIATLATIIVVLVVTQEPYKVRGVWDVAGGVGGNGG